MPRMNRVFVDAEGTIIAVHPAEQEIGVEAYSTPEREAFLAFVPEDETPAIVSQDDPHDPHSVRHGKLKPDWRDRHGEAPVPDMISAIQGQVQLVHAGLYDQVLQAIAAIPDLLQRKEAEIRFGGGNWRRDDPLLQAVLGMLELTEAEVDDLWRGAAAR